MSWAEKTKSAGSDKPSGSSKKGADKAKNEIKDKKELMDTVAHQLPRAECPEGESPLETAWTLWVDKRSPDRKAQEVYMEGLKQLGTVRSIEEFLRLFAFIKKPGVFPRDHTLLVFRKGCKPMWEEFPNGGCWNYRIRRTNEQDSPADRIWESTVIGCIGEAFETPDVMGCVLSSRTKEIAVSIWNASNTNNPQFRFKIGERMREILGLSQNALLEYKDFQSSIKDFSGYRNAQVYIAQ